MIYDGATLSIPRPFMEICIPTSLDPTLAPPGCHVLSIFTQYTPYHLADGEWTNEKKEEFADTGRHYSTGFPL